MRLKLMNHLNLIASYVFEEITDAAAEDVARDFWKYLRSRLIDDTSQKVKVSEYVKERILRIDSAAFGAKYGVSLANVKKSKMQTDFVCSAVAILLHYSDVGRTMIDWS